MHGITGIDHALVGVEDLEGARKAWMRLGFTLSPRGRHIGWGTANYCIMFPQDYIELLGILDASQFTNNLDRFLTDGEGLLGVAFSCDDAPATAAALQQAGIAAEDPKDLKRILESEAGEELPEFQLVHLPPDATPGVSSFVAKHLTPEIVWRQQWLTHPNGATGLDSVTVAVDEPSRLLPAYAKLFGEDAVAAENLSLTVTTGGARLHFLAPEAVDDVSPLPPRGAPCGLALAVKAGDLGQAKRLLEENGVEHYEIDGARLQVPARAANGIAVEFRAEA